MQSKKYQKISLACSNELLEVFSNYLIEHSAGGVITDDSRTDDLPVLTAYIDTEYNPALTGDDLNKFHQSIKGNFDKADYKLIAFEYIEPEDWLAGWKKTFKPLHVTGKIVVRPSWESYQPQPGEIEIIIDPKMAFGTGHHETTAQCLKGLETLHVMGKRVLDYGCGSGILAIAAYKLGADRVVACDIDADAIACAEENFKLNRAHIELIHGNKYVAPLPCDIIAANLTIDQLIESYNELDKSLKPEGHIIFSGIPEFDKKRFLDFLFDKPYVINNELVGEEWVSYVASKDIDDGD